MQSNETLLEYMYESFRKTSAYTPYPFYEIIYREAIPEYEAEQVWVTYGCRGATLAVAEKRQD